MSKRHACLLRVGAAVVLFLLHAHVASAADDQLVVIGGAPAPGTYDTLDLVAEGAGFFKEERLSVSYQYTGSAVTAAQLVATGKGDIGAFSFEPVLIGYEKGLRLQFFFRRASKLIYVLAALDDGPIKTLEDFKGTDIGIISPSSASALIAQSMLQLAGLKKDDASYVPIGVGPQALNALASKRVAGAALPTVELVPFEVLGNKLRYFRHPVLKDIGNAGYAAAPETIQNKGDLLQRFARAIAKANVFILENPEAAARIFLQGTGAKVTDDTVRLKARELTLLKGEFDVADLTVKKIGYLPPEGVDLYINFLADNGLTKQKAPVSAVVQNQFIDFANDFNHAAVQAQARSAH